MRARTLQTCTRQQTQTLKHKRAHTGAHAHKTYKRNVCAEAYSDQNNIRHRQVHENVRWAIHEQVGNAALTALATYFPPRRPVPEKFGLQLLSEAVLPPKTQAALQKDAPKTAAVPPQTHKWIPMRRLGGPIRNPSAQAGRPDLNPRVQAGPPY